MRFYLAAAAVALAAATPASLAAQETVPDLTAGDDGMSELVERLQDPAEQERIASMLGTMGEVLLSLPIGPMMDAMSKATGQPNPDMGDDTTVRDLAGPQAEDFPEEIAERVPQMMGMMAGMVEGLDAMRPMLEAMAQTMRERVEHGGS